MAWLKVDPMEQRKEFVMQRQRQTASMAQLCRQFGISRKTGYKWWRRFRAQGMAGLQDRSRRPRRCRWRTRALWVQRIVEVQHQHPSWGCKKLRAILQRRWPRATRVPAASTIWRILRGLHPPRHARRRQRQRVVGAGLRAARVPNAVWAVDFKGRFRTRDGRWCEPLTVSDVASRYVLVVHGLPDQSVARSQRVFGKLFREHGLPDCIRSDNGGPFASRGAGGLSRLSAWWLQLGIAVECISPGHPEQNGVHERMHRTLKAETAQPPARNRRAQQRRFRQWQECFNQQRPHEALQMQVPAQHYQRSRRRCPVRLPTENYPADYAVRRVRSNGEIKWLGRRQFIGEALAGRRVGIHWRHPGCQAVYYQNVLLGELRGSKARCFHPVVTRPATSRAKNSSPLGGRNSQQKKQHHV